MQTAMAYLIYGSLVALFGGLLTSISILALSHILLILPIFFFFPKLFFKEWEKSTWALLAVSVAIVLSVLFNQDIAAHGYSSLTKIKYFFFGILAIVPYTHYVRNHFDQKKMSFLLYLILVASAIAGGAGIIGKITGFNPVSMREVNLDRNAGLFGMVLNYAHNLAYFQVLTLGLILASSEIKKYVNLKFLYVIFVFNLVCLYLTYTRGAWLAFVCAAPFYLFRDHKKKFILALVLFFVAAGISYKMAGESVQRQGSDTERLSQWQAAWMAFKERPILGYGYLNFEHYSVQIKKKYHLEAQHYGGHAHNNVLEMLATTGIVGCTAFIAWIGLWFWEMYKRRDLMARLGLPFIVAFFVSGITQSTISLGINLFFIMAIYSFTQVKVQPKVG